MNISKVVYVCVFLCECHYSVQALLVIYLQQDGCQSLCTLVITDKYDLTIYVTAADIRHSCRVKFFHLLNSVQGLHAL